MWVLWTVKLSRLSGYIKTVILSEVRNINYTLTYYLLTYLPTYFIPSNIWASVLRILATYQWAKSRMQCHHHIPVFPIISLTHNAHNNVNDQHPSIHPEGGEVGRGEDHNHSSR